jgi:hypothetical protein
VSVVVSGVIASQEVTSVEGTVSVVSAVRWTVRIPGVPWIPGIVVAVEASAPWIVWVVAPWTSPWIIGIVTPGTSPGIVSITKSYADAEATTKPEAIVETEPAIRIPERIPGIVETVSIRAVAAAVESSSGNWLIEATSTIAVEEWIVVVIVVGDVGVSTIAVIFIVRFFGQTALVVLIVVDVVAFTESRLVSKCSLTWFIVPLIGVCIHLRGRFSIGAVIGVVLIPVGVG